MEAHPAADELGVFNQPPAALHQGGRDRLQVLKSLIRHRFPQQRPQRLRRLQFRRAGRQPVQHHVGWLDQPLRHMPARVVHQDHQQLLPGGVGPPGKLLQCQTHPVGVGARQDQLQVATTLGVHKAIDVEPLVFRAAGGRGPTALGRPNPPGDRLESQPGLILGPQLDDLLGMVAAQRGQAVGQGVFSTPAALRHGRPPDSWGAALAGSTPSGSTTASRSRGAR